MRSKNRAFSLVLATAFAVALLAPARAARAYTSVSISFFHDSLAPYGSWVTVSSYGRCWRPTHVSVGWQPYLYGEWTYTDVGWTWVSYDPWGGDPYHYGTWVFTSRYGWVWIPGTVWAPAWVTWCIRDDYFGWAPVPPSFVVGVSGYVGPGVTVSRSAYVFVPATQFAGVNVSSVRLPSARNATFVASSRPMTRFAVQGGVLSSGGPPVSQVEQASGRHVARVSVREARTQPVPIGASFQGERGRAPVVAPAVERAKATGSSERHATEKVSRTQPSDVKSQRPAREPVHADPHERANPAPPSHQNPSHERSVQSVPPPSSKQNHERAAQAPPPQPPRQNHERTAQAPPPQPPRQNHERTAQSPPPKPQGPPQAAHANPPGKEKAREHGKED